ncbi:MAG: hypothetical protein JNN12_12200 [Bacteroidetes Order II. Incertae sedis bacterium]|nr:hypothetical protein [Bacteroidetes Order II. bacterium]
MPYLHDDYIEVISKYSLEEWEPLMDFIRVLEIKYSSQDQGSKKIFETDSVELREFLNIIHYKTPIMIVFDWVNWMEGKRFLQKLDTDFSLFSIPDLCKLMTVLVRADRFNEGLLQSSLENGLIINLLKAVQSKLKF